MMSKKLLSTLPFLAAQATAIALASVENKKQEYDAAVYDVLKVFYPNCEALKGNLTNKNSGLGVTCADSIED